MRKVTANLSEGGTPITETFIISDKEDPRLYILSILAEFNTGRKEARTLVEIISNVDRAEFYDWKEMMNDAQDFMYYCQRQNNNAYGNRGVKYRFKEICSSYKKFASGTFGNFISFVKEFGREAYNDMSILKTIDKDQYSKIKKNTK